MVGGTKTPGWSKLQAEDLKVHDRIAVTVETTFEGAVKSMEEQRLLNLPMKQNGGWPPPGRETTSCEPVLALARREKSNERHLRYGEGQIETGGGETRVNG
jgi:hypothetical protein